MAKEKSGSSKGFNSKKMAKKADIILGAKSLAAGESFEGGYPRTMDHHINTGKSPKKGYAD